MENQAHCDFVKLRNMLIRTHMHDLKDVTCDVHYENYRAHCIQQMTRCVPPPPGPAQRCESCRTALVSRVIPAPSSLSPLSTLQQADARQPHGKPNTHPAAAHARR